MNRRQFLSYLPLPFLPVSVLANGDDEVGIPVEPCPCCCTDDGFNWYSCDEAGVALPGDPAGCEAPEPEPEPEPEPLPDSDEPLPVDGSTDNDVSQVIQLPATGSGSSLAPAWATWSQWMPDIDVVEWENDGFRVFVWEHDPLRRWTRVTVEPYWMYRSRYLSPESVAPGQ
jgi:hypothetical protein